MSQLQQKIASESIKNIGSIATSSMIMEGRHENYVDKAEIAY